MIAEIQAQIVEQINEMGVDEKSLLTLTSTEKVAAIDDVIRPEFSLTTESNDFEKNENSNAQTSALSTDLTTVLRSTVAQTSETTTDFGTTGETTTFYSTVQAENSHRTLLLFQNTDLIINFDISS